MLHFRAAARLVLAASLAAALWVPASAFAQMGQAGQPSGMPDARMMSGIPMPMGDLPDGTVSVRVVRGEISNVLPGLRVELFVDGKSRTAQTDDSGRAQFAAVPAGADGKAVVTVGDERIESQRFTMPGKGGVRLLLAASGGGPSPQPGAPAVAGTVVFGGDTRIVIEFDDDTIAVFYLLDVVNSGAAPVNPVTPIVLDLPADAVSPTLLEGSSPQATVKGTRMSFAGPFKPGRTSAQIVYQLPPGGGERTLVQAFPVAVDMVSVAVQKVGGVQLRSAQIARQQEVPSDGKTYVAGDGASLPAGRPLAIDLTGLPHHETWPRTVALGLAIVILGAGLWTSLGRSRNGVEARRRELEGRREGLFADLLRLEREKRAGRLEADAYERLRGELLGTLERIYGELDSAAPGAPRVAAASGAPAGGD